MEEGGSGRKEAAEELRNLWQRSLFPSQPQRNSRRQVDFIIYVRYLRAILCTFQISVDFYYVPVGGRGGGMGAGEGGEEARERGIESTCVL